MSGRMLTQVTNDINLPKNVNNKTRREFEDVNSTNDDDFESPVPSLVNSSFDSTECKLLQVTGNDASQAKASSTTDISIIDSVCSVDETLHMSNVRQLVAGRPEIENDRTTNDEVSLLDGDDTVVCESTATATKQTDSSNQQATTKDRSDTESISHPTEMPGFGVDDGLQGFIPAVVVGEISPVRCVGTMYIHADDASSKTKEVLTDRNKFPIIRQGKSYISVEEHSESQSQSFFSCRDEATVSDNLSSSDVSFHTAHNNAGNTASISGSTLNDNVSEQLEGFCDFLSCRSGEEPSSHLYDLSSSRVDDNLSEHNSSLRSYNTCHKFNQEDIISTGILKKRGGDEVDGRQGKQPNIPPDILLIEVVESPNNKSVDSGTKNQLTMGRRGKFICCAGTVFLAILATSLSILLTTQQRSESNIVDNNSQEISPIRNTTLDTTTDSQTILPSNAPSQAPMIVPTHTADYVVSVYPSDAPSIHPTTSRHRDSEFLRPPKKNTPKVKVNLSQVPLAGNWLL